jgi:hypothetical protein
MGPKGEPDTKTNLPAARPTPTPNGGGLEYLHRNPCET